MIVKDLISVLSKYPENAEVYNNCVTKNLKGELVIIHKDNSEEIEQLREKWNKEQK